MPTFIPDAQFNDPKYSNAQKLADAVWGLRSQSGAGKAILQQGVPVLGADWLPVPDRHTTTETEIGALPQNFAVVLGAIAGLSEQVRQLAFATGVVIDTDAIAKKTADEIAQRLTSGGN